MPIKFHCPKCDARYVEWGAEKLGFKCPHCEDQKLVRLGSVASPLEAPPTLKRRTKKPEKSFAEEDMSTEYEGFEEGFESEETVVISPGLAAYSDEDSSADVVGAEDSDIIVDDEAAVADEFEIPEDLNFEDGGAVDVDSPTHFGDD